MTTKTGNLGLLAATHERNRLVAEHNGQLWRVVVALGGLVFALILVIIWGAYHYLSVSREYFGTDPFGRITRIYPLSQPTVPDHRIRDFAMEGVSKGFSIDFVHWREQLGQLEDYFLPDAAKSFSDQLNATNFITQVTTDQDVVSVTPVAAPVITWSGVDHNVKKWRIEIPLLLTFQNAKSRSTSQIKLIIFVTRVSQALKPEGIAIERVQYAN